MSTLWAVIPAAGSGSRLGARQPKQFLELEGRSLLDWSLSALLEAVSLAGVAVALPAGRADPERRGALADPRVTLCTGGDSRAESVSLGLRALPAADDDWVLVHDAARPCVPAVDIRRLVERVTGSGIGGILACRVNDTLKRGDDEGRVTATVLRDDLWRALTPQMFRVGELRGALEESLARGAPITDEASAVEHCAGRVQLVEASAENIKVTYPEDIPLAAYWLSRQRRESAA
ncbi:MAG: 2-C-methyl-D-erythritol 4-phosphate cytidylyltransferase [Halieaceae bacterium]|nr:2-C-methyl-D-erythritol 4-phosphate cytidylyltransferase [Halieaceae bacterium]